MRKSVLIPDCAGIIIGQIPRGVFFNTMADGQFNTMTIGWGSLGTEWSKPIFTAYIREGRFTRQLLEKNPEFTVSVPLDPKAAVPLVRLLGSNSGRDMDKAKEAGLSLKPARTNSVPGFLEAPLTLECKVIYTQKQDYLLGDPSIAKFYPQDVPSTATGANKDNHIMGFGGSVDSYVLK